MRHRNTLHLQQTSLVRRQGCAVGVAGEESVGGGDRLLLKMRDTAGVLPVEGKMVVTADVLQVEGVMKHRLGTLMIHPTAHSANQYRPAGSANFHICANNATCETVAKEHGVDLEQLVLWNEATFPGLTQTAKLRKGTRLALIAPASDEDSHKDATSRHQQQTAAGCNAKEKHTSSAQKRKRPPAKPIERDALVGRNVFVNTGTDRMMPMASVIKTAGDDSYQVRLAGQDKIVKSMDMVMRVSALEKHHWPKLLRDTAQVTVQRRDPDVIGPATFIGHIVKLKESKFTVAGEHGATHTAKADEMLIAADIVLEVLRPRPPITKKRPSRTPPKQPDSPLGGAHATPMSREVQRNVDMVIKFIEETRKTP